MIWTLLFSRALAGPELCDGVDNDGDGFTDEGPHLVLPDVDGDDYVDGADLSVATVVLTDCLTSPVLGIDCNDASGSVHPGATETCNGIDDDCDGVVDDGDVCGGSAFYSSVGVSYYVTGSDDWNAQVAACSGSGYHLAFHDNAAEQTFLQGELGATRYWAGISGPSGTSNRSSWVTVLGGSLPHAPWNSGEPDNTCGIFRSSNYNYASQPCSNNYPGLCEAACQPVTWYLDNDGDGVGTSLSESSACTAPANHVRFSGDCNDGEASVYPGNQEICDDGLDNDCNPLTSDVCGVTWYLDSDDDGFGDPMVTLVQVTQPTGYVANPDDCDDGLGGVNPDADEICNGIDDNCDLLVDDLDPLVDLSTGTLWFTDDDEDLFGAGAGTLRCDPVGTEVADDGDCDDADEDVFPGAPETCNGVDDDCDGSTDEGVQTAFFEDGDGDLFGDPLSTLDACTLPAGYVAVAGDCDDGRGDVNPDATEVCDTVDNDCDNAVDEGVLATFWLDVDGDDYGDPGSPVAACTAPVGAVDDDNDCDDRDATAYPGAPEVCDGDLEDCDGSIDAGVTTTYYQDQDDDGHGNPSVPTEACALPAGFATTPDDCNDAEAAAWDGAVEVCDGIDNNCVGGTDEGVLLTFWRDTDADGFGDATQQVLACTLPNNAADNPDDCDDARPEANPEASELCNGLDDDCDTTVDEDTLDVQWFVDGDGDGFGAELGDLACAQPSGQVILDGDCNDGDPAIFPDAHEVCDGADNDCDGTIDLGAEDATLYYLDFDGDGYGPLSSALLACTVPTNGVLLSGDCNDGDPTVYNLAPELCDGLDNDCDGPVDEDPSNPFDWYPDTDEDGFGDPDGTVITQCAEPAGHVLDATDCDDDEVSVYPGATELCDNLDNDCDTLIDDDVMDQQYYLDGDGDGYGSSVAGDLACFPPDGQVANQLDCDDTNSVVNPAGTEICNGIDDDCDGDIDLDAVVGTQTWYRDVDGDGYGDLADAVTACSVPAGYVSNPDDCDDTAIDISPIGSEICDGLDNDCNGLDDDDLPLDDYFPDLDGDGFGDDSASPVQDCGPSPGAVADNSDCDDTTDAVNPDATDIPGNGVDEDCDGADASGPPPTPTDIPPGDTADTGLDGAPLSVRDAGCRCDVSDAPWSFAGWLRR